MTSDRIHPDRLAHPLIVDVAIDVNALAEMAEFYESMLEYERAWDRPGHVYLTDPSGLGPHLYLQQVPEPRKDKNRLHLDIVVPSLPDAVERAVHLGATRVEERRTAFTWFEVLADPEGNLFCLVDLATWQQSKPRGGNTPTSERFCCTSSNTGAMSDAARDQSELKIDRSAAVRRIELDRLSWVDIHENFVVDAGTEFRALLDNTPWQQTEVLRYDHYITEQRLSAGLRAESQPLLRQTNLHVTAKYRVPFRGVAAILYRDGRDFQGLHSDRELRWLDDTIVAIVVLGERRPFVIRHRAPLSEVVVKVPAGADPEDLVLLPGEGDMLVMGGAFQRDWLHGVPAADTDKPRISLTWRWTSKRGRPDTNPTYYDGRQFSDRPRQPGSRSKTGASDGRRT